MGKEVQVTLRYNRENINASVDASLNPAQIARICKEHGASAVKVIHKGKVLSPGENVPSRAKLLVVITTAGDEERSKQLPWPLSLLEAYVSEHAVDVALAWLDWLVGFTSSVWRHIQPYSTTEHKRGSTYRVAGGDTVALSVSLSGDSDEETITCKWTAEDCGDIVTDKIQTFTGVGPHTSRAVLRSSGMAGTVTCVVASQEGSGQQTEVFWFEEVEEEAQGQGQGGS